MRTADHPIVSQRYFFPRKASLPEAQWVEVDGARLACSRLDFGHQSTLVHFHGNGEIVSDYLPWFGEVASALGMNLFLAEYRGYGASTGVPLLGSMLDDVPALLAAAGPPESLVVFGRSVGSIYAIEAVSRAPEIRGLIIESGIADPLERVLLRASPAELGVQADAMREEFARDFDHESKLRRFVGPALFLHAAGDDLVMPSHAEANASWHAGETTLRILPKGDHNSIFPANREAYMRSLLEFAKNL